MNEIINRAMIILETGKMTTNFSQLQVSCNHQVNDLILLKIF